MDPPFDRGEIDRASLDATERLRARLSSPPVVPAAAGRRNLFGWIFAVSLLVFSGGMIANPQFEANVRGLLSFALPKSRTAQQDPAFVAMQQQLVQLEGQLAATKGGPKARAPAERLARTEANVETSTDQIARESDRIDHMTRDVAALTARLDADRARNDAALAAGLMAANRAEALLTLVLVRRAVESGRSLGALDAALRRGFETRYPGAVMAVTALGAAPVTLDGLRRSLAAALPADGAQRPVASSRQSWWDVLTATLSPAQVRPAATVSTGPAARASVALARGDIVAAANEVRGLQTPRSPAVSAWLDSVDRLRAGMQGLSTLETAALLGQPEPLLAVAATLAAP
jgi:hypothetical protein